MVGERWVRITMGMVVAAAAAYLFYRLRFVLATVTLAAMLAYAILPLVEFAAQLRVSGRALPRLAAVAAMFTLIILATAVMFALAAGPVGGEFARLVQNTAQYRDQLGNFLFRARTAVEESLPPDLQQTLEEALDRLGTLLVDAAGHVVRATAEWLGHIVEIILVPILAFYFLVDLPTLKRELLQFLPTSARQAAQQAAHRLDPILAGYVRGQIILMLIAGVVVWAGLALMGMRFALLLGIVAGLTRAIPIIGPVLGAIPIVGLALLQSPSLGAAVLLFFATLQVVESKVILPQVIGRQLNLHAATIILALLVGNALFGLIGMFLAAPVAAFAKEMLALLEGRAVEPAGPPDAG